MHAHAYEYNQANLELLNHSVQDMLHDVDEKAVEKQRDELTVKLIKAKANASALV